MYRRSIQDPNGFWDEMAQKHIHWERPYDFVRTVLLLSCLLPPLFLSAGIAVFLPLFAILARDVRAAVCAHRLRLVLRMLRAILCPCMRLWALARCCWSYLSCACIT